NIHWSLYHCGMQLRNRRDFLMAALGAASVGSLAACMKEAKKMPETTRMPVAFIGHGSPRSAVSPNEWTEAWQKLGGELPHPSAILTISAHWQKRGGQPPPSVRDPDICGALADARRSSGYRKPRAAHEL